MSDQRVERVRGKRVLITGGAGFIGSHLVERMVDENEVVVLDTMGRNALQYTSAWGHANLRILPGDVRDEALVGEACRGCQLVVHMASIAGVDTVRAQPVETMEIAILGTYNVLRACRQSTRIERVIDFSTSEVFGQYAFNVHEGNTTTLGAIGEARWTYAVSKLATEHLAHNYHAQYDLPTVSVRPFNVYGPRQVGPGAIKAFVLRAIRDEPIDIHGDGGQIRAWCYIDDIIDAILGCLVKAEAIGQVFNIGNPRSTITIYNLARLVQRVCGSRSSLRFLDVDQSDVELRIPNIEKARRLLAFEPRVDLEEGLERTADYFRDHEHGDRPR